MTRTRPRIRYAPLLASRWTRDKRQARILLDGLGPRRAGDALFGEFHATPPPRGQARSPLTALFFALVAASLLLSTLGYAPISLLLSIPLVAFAMVSGRAGHHRFVLAKELAKRDDARSVGALAELWSTGDPLMEHVPSPFLVAELTRLLTLHRKGHFVEKPDRETRAQLAAGLTRRIDAPLLHRRSSAADLPDAEADLLVSIVQLLGSAPSADEKQTLERVAAYVTTAPNRAFVRDAARAVLASLAEEASAASAAAPFAPTVAPSPDVAAPRIIRGGSGRS